MKKTQKKVISTIILLLALNLASGIFVHAKAFTLSNSQTLSSRFEDKYVNNLSAPVLIQTQKNAAPGICSIQNVFNTSATASVNLQNANLDLQQQANEIAQNALALNPNLYLGCTAISLAGVSVSQTLTVQNLHSSLALAQPNSSSLSAYTLKSVNNKSAENLIASENFSLSYKNEKSSTTTTDIYYLAITVFKTISKNQDLALIQVWRC